MHDAEIRLVRESWDFVERDPDGVADAIYRRFFHLDPGAAELFPADMSAQRSHMVRALRSVVRCLDRPGDIEPLVAAMGPRHAGYGVRREHFDALEEAVVGALAEAGGDAFGARHARAWRRAYRLVRDVMLDAAGPTPARAGRRPGLGRWLQRTLGA